jgi:pyridoxal biosynthesis lyase PdxS
VVKSIFKYNKEIEMEQQTGTFAVKKGLAQMLKGGVIMDVVTPRLRKTLAPAR